MPEGTKDLRTGIGLSYGEVREGPTMWAETWPLFGNKDFPIDGGFTFRIYDRVGIDLSTLEILLGSATYGSCDSEITVVSLRDVHEYLIYFTPNLLQYETSYVIQFCVSNRAGVPGMYTMGDIL